MLQEMHGKIKLLIRLFAITLLAMSCNEPGPDVAPTMEFLPAHIPFITGDTTLPKEGFFNVHLAGNKGSSDLSELELRENDILIHPARIEIINSVGFLTPANPFNIPSEENEGFEYAVSIDKPQSGNFEYTYILRDVNTLTFSKKINLLFYDIPVQLEITNTVPAEIPVGSLFDVDLHILRGTNYVDTLKVFEDGSLITDLIRIRKDGSSVESNPHRLPTNNVSYPYHLSIQVVEPGLKVYTIEVKDRDAYTDVVVVTVTGI